jgi:hypothetical protein
VPLFSSRFRQPLCGRIMVTFGSNDTNVHNFVFTFLDGKDSILKIGISCLKKYQQKSADKKEK